MERKDFLKAASVVGLGSLIPFKKRAALAAGKTVDQTQTCTLIPTETAGPFPLDLTANTYYFRQDIRESKPGVQLNLRLKINGINNCGPMQNLRVNIWHCDKDGLYSGYSQTNNPGQAAFTYLRGYQITDANGEVEFITIFPGWYNGRICHIHFQVYVSSSYAAISQLTFDIATKQAIYAANPTIYTNAADHMTLASDNIFSDGYAYQMAILTPNTTTGGYDSYLEATIQGSGTVGIGNLEKENEKQFSLGQNYPNPYIGETTVPFTLANPSDVKLSLWDLQGKLVTEISKNNLTAGDHNFILNMATFGIPTGNYAYQLKVENNYGTFISCKLMTAGK